MYINICHYIYEKKQNKKNELFKRYPEKQIFFFVET